MTTLEVIRAGTTYNLTDGTICHLVAEDGWGMATVRRLEERGPQQDGMTDLGKRLDPRNARLQLLANLTPEASQLPTHYDRRTTLRRIFRPSNTPLTFRWTLDNGDVRDFTGHFISGLGFGRGERMGNSLTSIAEIRCSNPLCVDPTPVFATFALAAGGAAFTIPSKMPSFLGVSGTINTTITIAYAGEWQAYPTIEVVGPITDPVITHLGTGDVLDLTGTSLGAGTTYTIDLRYGYKTVVDQLGANQIAALSNASDLATFALLPDPELADGLNSIRVTGSGATSATAVYLRWNTVYLGI